LRQAGGGAKKILLAAGAKRFGVPVDQCHAESGAVVRTSSGERVSYGELVSTARDLKLDGGIDLKDPKDFHVIGTSVPRVDLDAMVTGTLAYGLDSRVPDMRFATVARSPVLGGTVTSFDATVAKAVAGVRDVVQITSGVAVVADNSWAAMQGRAALVVQFDDGPLQAHSTSTIDQALSDGLQKLVASVPPGSSSAIEAEYTTPYLAHAPMEPLSCVADVRSDHCEVWAPTQNPVDVQKFVQDAVGVPTVVHVTMVGGGFGRRLEVDFAVEAAETSKAVGHPVQVLWTREDDVRHDFYRPPTRHWMRAEVDGSHQLASWRHIIAGPGLNGQIYQVGREVLLDGLDVSYSIPDNVSNATLVDIKLPTGPWRAVIDGPNAFANECFLDEVAAALSRDPLELRMALLTDSDVMKPVVALVADKAGWTSPVPAGRGRGIACHRRADTPVAMVAEVSVAGGVVRVHKVVCAIDCGTVINPDMVVQQMEGGIVYGLTAFLKGQITFDRGRVQQGNFDDYPLLQLAEMPEVEVHIVPSTRPPKGVGEMGVPPIAPAVANALFTITGKRIRHMPVTPADL